jgi:hypothetical protein
MPRLTRNTWPSGWRRCVSRTFHGMSCGANVTSRPAATHSLCTASTSSTQTDIQTPLSPASSPSFWNVVVFAPRPRPPCAPLQRKISHSPEPMAPNVGGVPESQSFFHPHFSNHAKLAAMSDTFNIGVMAFAFMMGKDNTGPRIMAFAGVRGRLLLREHFRIGFNIWQFLWRRRTTARKRLRRSS